MSISLKLFHMSLFPAESAASEDLQMSTFTVYRYFNARLGETLPQRMQIMPAFSKDRLSCFRPSNFISRTVSADSAAPG